MKQIVIMPLINEGINRGRDPYGMDLNKFRSNLDHSVHSINTWKYWCKKNNKIFKIIERKYGSKEFQDLTSVTFAKYVAAWEAIHENGPDTMVAVVDADTMIRWDAPDFFEGMPADAGVGAVIESPDAVEWIQKSIDAFKPVLAGNKPVVKVKPSMYFNSGVMVFNGAASQPWLELFMWVCQQKGERLRKIYENADVGTDQTIANYLLVKSKTKFYPLDPRFNHLHCFGTLEYNVEQTPEDRIRVLKEEFNKVPITEMFDFMKDNYIWHFTSSVPYRERLMRECWIRCARNYE